MGSGGEDEQQGTMKNREQGTVYTPFIDLEPDKTNNKVVKALVLKMWKFEKKNIGKVWGLELHLMDHNKRLRRDVCILFEDLVLQNQQLVTVLFLLSILCG
ncbi:hypothetical protein MKX03_025259 [Papaver bracteatum]|nr:hypothetical protein MKX03_025259 [Papaver bracteatum]